MCCRVYLVFVCFRLRFGCGQELGFYILHVKAAKNQRIPFWDLYVDRLGMESGRLEEIGSSSRSRGRGRSNSVCVCISISTSTITSGVELSGPWETMLDVYKEDLTHLHGIVLHLNLTSDSDTMGTCYREFVSWISDIMMQLCGK